MTAKITTTKSSRFVALAVGLALVAAACSTEQAAPVPTLQLTTTTTVITTTTEATTTTTEATTTTTEDPQIAEVTAAVTGFRSEQFGAFNDADQPVESLNQYATEALLVSFTSYIQKARAEGRTFDGQFEAAPPIEILLEGERASVLECGRDAGNAYNSDGSLIDSGPDGGAWILRRYFLVIEEGRWKVTKIEFEGGEKTRCEP